MSESGRVFVPAPAKVNLFLHVGDKRADGYHDLESLAVFAALEDGIWLEPANHFSLAVTGPFAAGLARGDDNLTIRAAKALAEWAQVGSGARITLRKTIPLASGLGGGSADAAAVLRGLVRLWKFDANNEELRGVAASIGSDIPVCIDSATAWMEGRGERVTLLPVLPAIRLLLVNPLVAVSTAQAFATLGSRHSLGLACPRAPFQDAAALVRFLKSTANDLEQPARAIAPVIGEVIDEIARLPGVLLARMSGSGATCFGLFGDDHHVHEAMALLRARRANWWLAGTSLCAESAAAPVFVQ